MPNLLATIAGIEAGVAFWGLTAVFGLTAVLAASKWRRTSCASRASFS
ncbi:threonine/homoserine/homoserine lactone efflux protein [Amycolatopsis lexingtonensis]|uniref:Threonine/homoserine/homoserine lactone efflux protein n=1 Tax=Amycolatopsis lexingtonensis TaxID=218822 RepID=A0ABR9IBD9_9PSEU|nr:hypothetical protein [Amycolatopsis lexingtonensis]MBE1500495.1 threonine/homoserine/homoserine lactone efflux protein [Amycolatopsis lexingtonensis]